MPHQNIYQLNPHHLGQTYNICKEVYANLIYITRLTTSMKVPGQVGDLRKK